MFAQFRYENLVFLEICLAANLPAGVELRGTCSVGITPSNESRFSGDSALLCHSLGTISRVSGFFQVGRNGAAFPRGAVGMLMFV